MNHEEIIVEAVHDLCEECMSKQHCQGICHDVERMKKLALDVRKEEQEWCIREAQDAHCAICGDIDCILVDKSNNERRMKCNQLRCVRKAMEGGSHGN